MFYLAGFCRTVDVKSMNLREFIASSPALLALESIGKVHNRMVHRMSSSDAGMGGDKAPMNKTFGAIDLGSHTIRLLVAELREQNRLWPLHADRRITQLAQGFDLRQALGESAMDRSFHVLWEYAERFQAMGVSTVKCGATGVLRRARNSHELLNRVKVMTGIVPHVLAEEEEALLSARGVLSVLPDPGGCVVLFDLGGSSTEFTVLAPKNPDGLWCTSVFVGAATLTERYLREDPPGWVAMEQASRYIVHALAPTLSRVARILTVSCSASHPVTLVGTAGTVTTLAAMKLKMQKYQPHRINGLTLDHDHIVEMIRILASSTIKQRLCLDGIEPGREEIILGGAMVVRGIMEGLNMKELVVTDAGLLEGLLLDAVETACGLPKTLVSPLTWHL